LAAAGLESGFVPLMRSDIKVTYGPVAIDGKVYILPTRSMRLGESDPCRSCRNGKQASTRGGESRPVQIYRRGSRSNLVGSREVQASAPIITNRASASRLRLFSGSWDRFDRSPGGKNEGRREWHGI
jgi:hypothetical protein